MSDTLSGSMLTDASVTEAKLDTTFSSKVTNAYNQANSAYAQANTALASLQVGQTVTGNLAVTGNLTIGGTVALGGVFESANITSTALSANVNFDILTQPILYLNTSASANSTINFRGNSTVTMDNFLSTGNSVTVTLLVTNGATAYKVNNVQIDGVPFTPKWAGGFAPTIGSTNSVDLYNFTLIKTSSLNYTVLASLQKYA